MQISAYLYYTSTRQHGNGDDLFVLLQRGYQYLCFVYSVVAFTAPVKS